MKPSEFYKYLRVRQPDGTLAKPKHLTDAEKELMDLCENKHVSEIIITKWRRFETSKTLSTVINYLQNQEKNGN